MLSIFKKKKQLEQDHLLEKNAEEVAKLKEKRIRAEAKLEIYKQRQAEREKLKKAKRELRREKLIRLGILKRKTNKEDNQN
jgi:hypothetical protein